MLDNIKIEDVLFIDIETVPEVPSMDLLDPLKKTLWDKKSRQFRETDQSAEDVFERAGIYSEFGRIICISVGFIRDKNPFTLRLKSFYGEDERSLLNEFSQMVLKFSRSNREALLCAHNGKEFDFP